MVGGPSQAGAAWVHAHSRDVWTQQSSKLVDGDRAAIVQMVGSVIVIWML
jgi:hypothetical protein